MESEKRDIGGFTEKSAVNETVERNGNIDEVSVLN